MDAIRETATLTRPYNIALVGNPNTGKTTLFNSLTGYHQRVGNFPGVTVEIKVGELRAVDRRPDESLRLLDLPGSYSLHAESADEAILLDVLLGHHPEMPAPDALLCVVDACHLRRNLFLATQVIELNLPVVIALNMVDLAEAEGIKVDPEKLSKELGVPVIPMVATREKTVRPVKDKLAEVLREKSEPAGTSWRLPDDLQAVVLRLTEQFPADGDATPHSTRARVVELTQALLAPGGFMESRLQRRHGAEIEGALKSSRAALVETRGSLVEVEAQSRYAWIDEVVGNVVERVSSGRHLRSDRVDKLLTHRFWGLLIFLGLMGVCFQAVYSWAGPFMDVIDTAFGWLGASVGELLPAGAFQSMLTDGIVAGVGAVLIFLPQILILFLFIAILEDCGYMARVAFLLDRWMGWVGLSGRSFVPLISSFACAIPGILATRTIEDRRSRYATMLIAPLMSCSARLPVYVLLISTFVPAQALLGGWLGLQGLVMLSLYALGVIVALVVAFILNRTILTGRAPSFLMELPSYKWPSIRTVFFRLYDQGKEFCISAGTIIFATTIIIWALGYYPRSAQIQQSHEQLRQEAASMADEETRDARLSEIDRLEAGANLRNSYLGRAGTWIEPVVVPLGWDWRIGTAAIASFPAREVVISTLGTLFNLGADTDETSVSLREKLKSAKTESGRHVFDLPVALSIMVFFALCCQCGATLAVIKRETRAWRWPVFTFVYMTGLAYVAALLTYQVSTRIIG